MSLVALAERAAASSGAASSTRAEPSPLSLARAERAASTLSAREARGPGGRFVKDGGAELELASHRIGEVPTGLQLQAASIGAHAPLGKACALEGELLRDWIRPDALASRPPQSMPGGEMPGFADDDAPAAGVDPDLTEKLRALGYVE